MRVLGLILSVALLASCQSWKALSSDELVPEEAIERIRAKKATEAQSLAEQRAQRQKETFGILADFVGNTYRGEPTGGSAEAVADIQQWTWADEDAPTLLIQHSLEDGSYGGDTLVRRDAETGELSYVYKTTAGFTTRGTFAVSKAGVWEAVEDVEGHAEITKVRSKGHQRSDGALVSTSEYLKNGRWVPGHSFVYTKSDRTLAEHLEKPAVWEVWKR